MTFLINPRFGSPGAPQYLNWWDGNQFRMSIPPLPPPMPTSPPPMAPATTPQDSAAQQATQGLARGSLPSGDPGGGSTGGSLTGGAPSAPGAPGKNSTDWGNVGSWAGLAASAIPGVGGMLAGPALSMGGQLTDLNTANRNIAQANQQFGTSIPSLGLGAFASGMLNDSLLGRVTGWGRDPVMAAFNAIADAKSGLSRDQSVAQAPAASSPAWHGFMGDISFGGGTGNDLDTSGPAPGPPGDWGGIFSGPVTPDAVYGPIDYGYGSQGHGIDSGASHSAGDTNVGGTPAYAKGGRVRKPGPGMPNPPGPDDQIAAVQSGEGILTRKAMKRLPPGLLDALNRGDMKKAKGLLG